MTKMVMTSSTNLIWCPPVCRVRYKLETVAIGSFVAMIEYSVYNIWKIVVGAVGGAAMRGPEASGGEVKAEIASLRLDLAVE